MREYLVVFLVAAVVSYLLCVVARELAIHAKAVAEVRDRDVHAVPIPYFGGLAMLGGLAAGFLVAHHLPFLSTAGDVTFHDAGVVLIGGAIVCAVGVLDDLIELDALTKLGGQVVAAAFLVLNDVQLISFTIPGTQFSLDPTQGMLLTVLLVVGTVNAVNFVDGLDGLAGGVVGIGAVAFFAFSYKLAEFNGETLAITAALLCAALGGACVGFLPHNFSPARIFMGDSGSMLLGLVLAGSALTLTGQFSTVDLDVNAGAGASPPPLAMLVPFLLPIAILLVPFTDLVLAVVRRTRAGKMFYQPDKKHLHHRLLEIGHSQRRAVLIMWLWAALLAFGSVLISIYSRPLVWALIALWFVGTLFATFLVPRLRPPHELTAGGSG
ncbi:undecaprenyl-phosphate alpha-N-acetylglucosaminyl 1-phosphate transferase [Marmoricola endophyticus]|uniref:Undecaprenyl-phosphate alpha-N-acetylglucosaminyl 1-phosphate transferase n=1 Tax=Marmoricola endophyticus TaxID=2040280 RepID=A0A917BFN8_9ACTN|nr:MraY family glycosyltransferase [Marmoricola endophyticus]GGF40995.1 undecaprenyl-phosphate alpha-N-acetylglucosaminyl 1-phosphate transferase [Marmoricola endophyticus]